jgi:hypothetical protein
VGALASQHSECYSVSNNSLFNQAMAAQQYQQLANFDPIRHLRELEIKQQLMQLQEQAKQRPVRNDKLLLLEPL